MDWSVRAQWRRRQVQQLGAALATAAGHLRDLEACDPQDATRRGQILDQLEGAMIRGYQAAVGLADEHRHPATYRPEPST